MGGGSPVALMKCQPTAANSTKRCHGVTPWRLRLHIVGSPQQGHHRRLLASSCWEPNQACMHCGFLSRCSPTASQPSRVERPDWGMAARSQAQVGAQEGRRAVHLAGLHHLLCLACAEKQAAAWYGHWRKGQFMCSFSLMPSRPHVGVTHPRRVCALTGSSSGSNGSSSSSSNSGRPPGDVMGSSASPPPPAAAAAGGGLGAGGAMGLGDLLSSAMDAPRARYQLAGLGFGLPMSRLYARYFGGWHPGDRGAHVVYM
jgi:hypothetical protein